MGVLSSQFFFAFILLYSMSNLNNYTLILCYLCNSLHLTSSTSFKGFLTLSNVLIRNAMQAVDLSKSHEVFLFQVWSVGELGQTIHSHTEHEKRSRSSIAKKNPFAVCNQELYWFYKTQKICYLFFVFSIGILSVNHLEIYRHLQNSFIT